MTWWQYFGARRAPFPRDPAPEAVFPAPALAECRARFDHILAERGVWVVTGESGLGKTTLIRILLHALNPNQYHALYLVVGDDWTSRTLYRQLAYELHLPIPAWPLEIERAVRQALWAETTQQGRLPVLVLDESHWLTPAVLQSLRTLLNFAMDTTAPLALILVGHTELRRKLALQPLEAFRERVTMAFHLPPFSATETADYLTYQLQQVGIERPVFTDAAVKAAHDWAQGRPRRLNAWARACLLAAYVAQQTIIDDAVVATAQAELQWTQPVTHEGGRTS